MNVQRNDILLRRLGIWSVIAIGIGSILGGGPFTLTGHAAGLAGPSLIFLALLNGLIALMTVFAYAELSAAYPEAGGGYIWVRRALGGLAGHISGWISWFANAVACGVYSLSLTFYLIYILNIVSPFGIIIDNPAFWQKVITILAIGFLAWINYRGVSIFGKVTLTIVIIEITGILIFIILGFAGIFSEGTELKNIAPILPNGLGGLFAAMGLMVIAFEGSEIVAQSSEEVIDIKSLLRAIFISFAVIVILYLLIFSAVILGVKTAIPSWQILGKAGEGALISAARYFSLPKLAVPVVLLSGLLASLAALNTTIFSSSHVFFAMARSQSIPKWMSHLHKKHKTPHIGIIASAILTAGITLVLPIKDVAAIADILFILLFCQIHLALIELRKIDPETSRPFKMPFYPLPSLIALGSYAILIWQLVHLSPWGVTVSVIWIFLGFMIYTYYAQPREIEELESQMVSSFEEEFEDEIKTKIILPISHQIKWEIISPFIKAVAKETNGKIHIVKIIEFPASVPAQITIKQRDSLEKIYKKISADLSKDEISHHIISVKTRNFAQTILDTVKAEKSDLLILPVEYISFYWRRNLETLNKVLRESGCDLMILKGGYAPPEPKVLMPISFCSHNKLLGRAANSLGHYLKAAIFAFHVTGAGKTDEDSKDILTSLKIANNILVNLKAIPPREITSAIMEEMKDKDIIILAAAPEPTFGRIRLGATTEKIIQEIDKPIVIVYHHQVLIEPLIFQVFKRFRLFFHHSLAKSDLAS